MTFSPAKKRHSMLEVRKIRGQIHPPPVLHMRKLRPKTLSDFLSPLKELTTCWKGNACKKLNTTAVISECCKRVYDSVSEEWHMWWAFRSMQICGWLGQSGRYEELEPNFEKQVSMLSIKEDGILRSSKILKGAWRFMLGNSRSIFLPGHRDIFF